MESLSYKKSSRLSMIDHEVKSVSKGSIEKKS